MNLNSPFSVSSPLALAHLRVAACYHTDRQRKQPLCISRARSLEVSCGDKTRDRGRDSNYDFDRRALVSIILSVQTYTLSMQRAGHTWVQLGEIVTFLVDTRKTVNGDSPDAAAGAPRHYHGFSTSGNRDTRNKEKAQSVPGNNGPGRSGDNSGRGDDTPSSASGDDPGPQFACHFYKKNPSQYRMCLRYNLTTVSRVQQHLKRCHTPILQCPTCRCTFGENQCDFDEHLRARSCQSRLLPLMPERALSEETWRSITARRRTPHQSARDRWYVIWTIIFPGEPLPPSPYYTVNETTQQLVALNNHFIENGYGRSLVDDIMQLLSPELQVIGFMRR
ncbi:hypothetical protein GQ53DRAFT_761271 [Thozetella sp. PMI_491]|nr:hypothetical protein GQ53DRAFT_761271 [Thozetella sp. PMI_491]